MPVAPAGAAARMCSSPPAPVPVPGPAVRVRSEPARSVSPAAAPLLRSSNPTGGRTVVPVATPGVAVRWKQVMEYAVSHNGFDCGHDDQWSLITQRQFDVLPG